MATGLGRALDQFPVAVALVDRDGVLRYANAAAAERYGWRSPASVVGLSVAVMGEGLPERTASRSWRGELPATSAAGTFVGSFLVAPFVDDDFDGSIVVCFDTSRRQEAERAAERLALLQRITARLAGARDVDAIGAVLATEAAAAIRANACAFVPFDAVASVGSFDFVVPLEREGRSFGTLAFRFERAVELSEDDHRFALAIATQTTQALERIRLDDLERRARRRQEFLARATGLLAGSLDHEATALAVGRLAVQELADSFSVHLLDRGKLVTVVAVHADPALEELLLEVVQGPAGDPLARLLDDVVTSGRTVFQPVVGDISLGDPVAAKSLAPFEIGSAIIVGLQAGGRALGTLTVTRRQGRSPFDEDSLVLVSELAGRLAATVDSVVAHRARAEEARTLQASLLPPRLPEIPGIRIASRYDPVGDGSLVGGDFYDVFPMGEGRWGLVLGDVCGQGVPAAALTALVRYTVRAAARIWQSPAEILRFSNDALLEHDIGERFCTVLFCVLRPGAHGAIATIASAGHHLPLHLTAGQRARSVGQSGTALGLVRTAEVSDVTVSLGAGDQLVLFTDGVVEARDLDGNVVDEEFLARVVAAHEGEGVDDLAAAIERAVLDVSGGRALDDIALLVAEVTGTEP